jgi:TonB family protein
MPAEFLRDVVRPPAARRSRTWSVLPLSIAVHAAGALAFFIMPLAAEEPPPAPLPVSRALNIVEARSVPGPPPPPETRRPPAPPQRRQAYRPGGEVSEPKKVLHVPPVYPPIALSAGVQGVVILEATISENGTIENVRTLRSHPLLERAAVEAVKRWRYTPTRLNGQPVPIILTVTVNFMIER